jgi:hypothetical protein
VSSRAALDDAVRVLDRHGVAHSEIRDLGEAFGISILIFRDPDNIQLELSGPRKYAVTDGERRLPRTRGARRVYGARSDAIALNSPVPCTTTIRAA